MLVSSSRKRVIVALFTGSEDHSANPRYQVFLRFDRRDRGPEDVAADVVHHLGLSPGTWQAGWHAIKQGIDAPPPMAGTAWQRERIG